MAERVEVRLASPVAAGAGAWQRRAVLGAGLVLTLLHQDFWLWDDGTVLLGFLPAGLAYHVVYSLAAAVFWVACIRWAWPARWERWAEQEEAGR